MIELHRFEQRADAVAAVTTALGTAIEASLADAPRCTLALAGGSTPRPVYAALARAPLPWQRVNVLATDERLVSTAHRDSNARLFRETLLVDAAAPARLLPLTATTLSSHPGVFAATLLGMGADGHFASIFPHATNRAAALDLSTSQDLFTVVTAASPYARLTLSLARLLRSRLLLLLIFGEDKRAVLEAPGQRPIAALTNQDQCPLHVYWAP